MRSQRQPGGGGVVGVGGGGSAARSPACESGDAAPHPAVHMAGCIDPVIIARSSLYRLSRMEIREND